MFYVFMIVIMILFIKFRKYRFDIDSLFKPAPPPIDDRHGVWYFCGRQGSNKNYMALCTILKQSPDKCNKIYTNVHSLKLPGYNIEYFTKLTELYDNVEEDCIFLIDEISRKFDRNSRTDTQFYAWLNQSRKRKRIVMLITQEWRELPMWIRRPAKFSFTTRPLFKPLQIFITTVGDAENLVFNKDEGEYECPPIQCIIWRRNKCITDLYDTFEPINQL